MGGDDGGDGDGGGQLSWMNVGLRVRLGRPLLRGG